MKVYLAADHAGFELKQQLLSFIQLLGHDAEDCGALALDEADDYPAIIASAARKLSADVASGIESRAVLIGASGQGEAMVANRFSGVRCALYYGPASVEQTDTDGKKLTMLISVREHNDANALALGARFISPEDAKAAVQTWLAALFSGDERHARRIREIDEVA